MKIAGDPAPFEELAPLPRGSRSGLGCSSQPVHAYSTSSVPLAGTSRFHRMAIFGRLVVVPSAIYRSRAASPTVGHSFAIKLRYRAKFQPIHTYTSDGNLIPVSHWKNAKISRLHIPHSNTKT